MTSEDVQEYVAGASSPVTEISHLFASRPEGDDAVMSLCGAVRTYGPVYPPDDADRLCVNCQRSRKSRKRQEKGQGDGDA